jgi:hypothetical protein
MADVPTALPVMPGLAGVELTPVEASRLIEGNPRQAAFNQFSNSRGNFHCGVWVSEPGTWRISYTEDELCVLLEGEAILTDAAGVSRRFGSGDAFVVPAGFVGTWQSIGTVRKYYAVYEEP